jgi:hypothetical protein
MAVTWSLAVEEQFYLTVPWIIRKVRRNLLCNTSKQDGRDTVEHVSFSRQKIPTARAPDQE